VTASVPTNGLTPLTWKITWTINYPPLNKPEVSNMTTKIGREFKELQTIDGSFVEPAGDCGSSVSYELMNEAEIVVNPTYLRLNGDEITMASSNCLDASTYKLKIKARLTNCPEVSVLSEIFNVTFVECE
jgi:hypothetical protein